MVAGLTIGKKKYAEVEEEMKAAIEPMHAICEHLLDDIKRDSESFDLYMQALTLPTAVTDALVATMMARTAVLGALFNVKINLESIKDEAFVAETTKEVEVLEKKAIEHEQKILAKAGVSKSVVE